MRDAARQAFRTRFPEDPPELEPLFLASLHMREQDPATSAIARALFIACLYDADMNVRAPKTSRQRHEGGACSPRKVREWQG